MALALLLSPLMAALTLPNLFVQTKTEITRANSYISIFYTYFTSSVPSDQENT